MSRISGDEFVVVAPGLHNQEPQLLAERLSACFSEPFVLEAATVLATASIGVVGGRGPQTAEELLLAADAAMYDAKSHGRGIVRLWSDELRQEADDRVRTEAELRLALERDELVLHYQPVVDLRRGVVTGVEALVRWQHPDGLRMPDSFIPAAEASGLIIPIGALVLEQACQQAAAWAADGLDLVMAVNFSARQIGHPEVIAGVEQALRASGLDPHRLLAEVTESTVMEDAELAQVALQRLAELGVGVAIDDFGTGYSSLLYLKRYPINALKVDRSFVAGMGVRSNDDAIVASVVGLARAVGAACIAEGVETPEQHAALRALDCDFAQGYLFSRPVPAVDVPAAVVACERLLGAPLPRAQRRSRVAPRLVPDQVLRRINEMRDEGGSLNTIAAALNADHTINPNGRRWHSRSVGKALDGPAPRLSLDAFSSEVVPT